MSWLKKTFSIGTVDNESKDLFKAGKTGLRGIILTPVKESWRDIPAEKINRYLVTLEAICCLAIPFIIVSMADNARLVRFILAFLVMILLSVIVNFAITLYGEYEYYLKNGKLRSIEIEKSENDGDNDENTES